MRSILGIALITVLLFVQIWMILSILSLTMVWTSIKINNEFWNKQQRMTLGRVIMQEIQHSIDHNRPICIIEPISTMELINKPLTWWEVSSCQGKKQSLGYYYLIENLGIDDCGYIVNQPRNALAIYFRISLLFKDSTQRLLQSTVALSTTSQEKCSGVLHPIDPGLQMQRWLDRVS